MSSAESYRRSTLTKGIMTSAQIEDMQATDKEV